MEKMKILDEKIYQQYKLNKDPNLSKILIKHS